MSNPDVKPQIESKTRFADVKGVDEVQPPFSSLVLSIAFCIFSLAVRQLCAWQTVLTTDRSLPGQV